MAQHVSSFYLEQRKKHTPVSDPDLSLRANCPLGAFANDEDTELRELLGACSGPGEVTERGAGFSLPPSEIAGAGVVPSAVCMFRVAGGRPDGAGAGAGAGPAVFFDLKRKAMSRF